MNKYWISVKEKFQRFLKLSLIEFIQKLISQNRYDLFLISYTMYIVL